MTVVAGYIAAQGFVRRFRTALHEHNQRDHP